MPKPSLIAAKTPLCGVPGPLFSRLSSFGDQMTAQEGSKERIKNEIQNGGENEYKMGSNWEGKLARGGAVRGGLLRVTWSAGIFGGPNNSLDSSPGKPWKQTLSGELSGEVWGSF